MQFFSRTPTRLSAEAVNPNTKERYTRAVYAFILFTMHMGLVLSTPASVDHSMATYFDDLFEEGLGPGTGDVVFCSWMDAFPEYRPGDLPLSARSLRAWRRLKPHRGRHPLPWSVCCAIAAFVAAIPEAGALAAIGILLLFDAYLRPYELLNMRWQDLLGPTGTFTTYAAIICPLVSGRPSKTKVFDDSVRFNSKNRPQVNFLVMWMITYLSQARTDRIFPFTHQQLAAWYAQGVNFLGLQAWGFVLYSCRHGGPSSDFAELERTEQEIADRGRWATLSSLRRYKQSGRLHVVLHNICPSVLAHCSKCESNLGILISKPRLMIAPSIDHAFSPPAPMPVGDEDVPLA